jgi:hypothetical protein
MAALLTEMAETALVTVAFVTLMVSWAPPGAVAVA